MSLKCILGFHKWSGGRCAICGKTRTTENPGDQTSRAQPAPSPHSPANTTTAKSPPQEPVASSSHAESGFSRGDRIVTRTNLDMNNLVVPQGTVGYVVSIKYVESLNKYWASCYFVGHNGIFSSISVATLSLSEPEAPSYAGPYDIEKAVSLLALGWLRGNEWECISRIPTACKPNLASRIFEELGKEHFASDSDWNSVAISQKVGLLARGLAAAGAVSIPPTVLFGEAHYAKKDRCRWAAQALRIIATDCDPNNIPTEHAASAVHFLTTVLKGLDHNDEDVPEVVASLGSFRRHAKCAAAFILAAQKHVDQNRSRRLWEIYNQALVMIGA